MAIRRYFADKDNTITNAYKANLQTRGVSGNMGQSDILETFSIYAQASSASSELTRILVQFPVTGTTSGYISYDREQGTIPPSGSTSFYLKMYNAAHSSTTPKSFTLTVHPISQSWTEGLGLDMENYSDEGASNWISASDGVAWTTEGGDYLSSPVFSQNFDSGFENLEVDVTSLVETWILGVTGNYGVEIKLTGSEESATDSYYTKMFFARGSQFFFKRPVLEVRWDSSKKDQRGNFFLSSSLVPAADNLMNLYLYNIVKGQLTNIPSVGTGNLLVSIYSGSTDNTAPSGSKLYLPVGGGVAATGDVNITGSWVETGIYSASFAYASSSITTIFDLWHGGGIDFYTGNGITVKTFKSYGYNFDQRYVSKVVNLRPIYSPEETARFRLYIRQKDWKPTIYTVSSEIMPNSIIDNTYYKVMRVSDELNVISYGTGSLNHTRLSYDTSGSYFDLDMSLLETDTVYSLKFVYLINELYVEQPEEFRFRVE